MADDPALQGPEGLVQRQNLLDKGYKPGEVDTWQHTKMQEQFDQGMKPEDIDSYWNRKPDMTSTQAHVDQTFSDLSEGDKQRVAQNPWEMFRAGLQTSAVEIPFGKPTILPPQHAGMANDILYRFGQAIGDTPATVLGWMGGRAIGGVAGGLAAGAAAGPEAAPAGATVGGLIGAGAGSAALPDAWRRIWMEHQADPEGYKTWGDFWSHAADIMHESGKQALIGGLAAPLGGLAGGAAASAGVGKVLSGVADAVTMAGGATAVGAAMDGHVPTAQDFESGAIMALGFHAVSMGGEFVGATKRYVASDPANVVQANLRDAYVETGRNPITVATAASHDVVLQGEVLGPKTADGTRVTPTLDAMKLPEPEAWAKPPTEAEALAAKEAETPPPEPPLNDSVKMAPEESKTLALQGDHDWAPPPATEAHAALAEGGGEPPKPPAETGGAPAAGEPEEPMTWQEARDKMVGLIAPDVKKGILPDWANPRKYLADFQSQLTPARTVDMLMGHDPNSKAMGVEDQAREGYYASGGRLNQFFRLGTLRITDPKTWKLGVSSEASLASAYKAVKEDGGNVVDFTSVRMALRTLEKQQQGIEIHPLLTPEVALARLDEPGLMDKYARGLRIMKEHKDGIVDYAQDAHLFSPELAQSMKDLNKAHIYLKRVMDPDYKPGGAGGNKIFNPVRKLTGGNRLFGDVVTGDFENAQAIVGMADRNLSRLNIIDHVLGAPQADLRKLGYDFSRVEVKDLDRDTLLNGQMLDEEGAPIADKDKEAMLPFLAERRFNENAENAKRSNFLVFRNGQPEVYHTANADLAATLGAEMHGTPPAIFHLAIKMAGLERTGIVGGMPFMVRSLIHQQMASSVTGRGAPIPFLNFFRGFGDTFGHTDAFEEAQAHGIGGEGAMSLLDRDPLLRNVTDTFNKAGTWSSMANVAKHPYDAWLAFSHRLHQASSVGGFKALKDQGYDPAKAAMIMRTDYLDHAEPLAASYANAFARMTPFMMTGIKDIEQFGRAMQDRPVSVIMKGLVKLTVPTMLLTLVNHEKDKTLPPGSRYSDLPAWRRALFWNLPVAGVHIAIPKPYAVGAIFAGMPQLVMDNMLAGRPTTAMEILQGMASQFLPPMIPTVASPVLDQVTNSHFSTGVPLVPASLAGVTNWMQYKPDTTVVAKKLTQVLGPVGIGGPNISPIVLDNYIQSWAGNLPMTAMKLLGAPWQAPGAPSTWSDNPVFGSFLARNPGMHSQVVEDLFTKMHEFETAHASFKLAEKRMDPDEIQANRTGMALAKISLIRKSLERQMGVLNAVNASKTLTDDEKTKRGDQMSEYLVRSAERSLLYLNRISK